MYKKIAADEILNKIDNILQKYRCWLVGGYLRNLYTGGGISADRDIVTIDNAYNLASEIKDYFDGVLVELDKKNQIYRVCLKDKINYFDIAQVRFDILEDAKRRDFTINSIFYDLNKKELYDPLNGIADIKNKIIKCCDFNNLIDDPLRLLRMYRFLSSTGFVIDNALAEFTKKNFHLVKNAAYERINQEIIHIFEGKYLNQALLAMYDDGALEIIFPFISEIKKIPPNTHHHLDLVHHSIETVNNIRLNNPLLKIAAFYHDIGKPSTWTILESGRHRFIGHDIEGAKIAYNELKMLKFSSKQIKYIQDMIRYHIYPAALVNSSDNKKAYARFFRKLKNNVVDIIELSRADRLSARGPAITDVVVENALNHLENLLNYYREVQSIIEAPKPLLDGVEVMELLNIKPSKKVGIILEALKEAQLEKKVSTKEDAIEFISSLNARFK